MELEAEIQAKENEQKELESFLSHPVARKAFTDSKEQQETLVDILCNNTVHDFETFFAHFEAVGHLRGLRRMEALLQFDLEEVKAQLKELKK